MLDIVAFAVMDKRTVHTAADVTPAAAAVDGAVVPARMEWT